MGSKGLGTSGRSSWSSRMASFSKSVTGRGALEVLAAIPIVAVGAVVVLRRALPLDHVEVDADLEEPDRRHEPVGLGARSAGHLLDRVFEAVFGRDGQGEPEVEGAVSRVVVADSRMLVDDPRAGVEAVGGEAHRHEHGLVAQLPRVEDRAYLPDDVLLFGSGDAGDDLRLGDARLLADLPEGLFDHGEGGLDDVEEGCGLSGPSQGLPKPYPAGCAPHGHRLNWIQTSMAGSAWSTSGDAAPDGEGWVVYMRSVRH